jgi:hypothetical protein
MRRILPALSLLLLAACQTPAAAPSRAPPQPTLSSEGFEPLGGAWEAAKNVNLRAGPGTEHPVMRLAKKGSPIAVKGRVPGSDWLAVSLGTLTGYVRADLVSLAPPPSSPVSTLPQPVMSPAEIQDAPASAPLPSVASEPLPLSMPEPATANANPPPPPADTNGARRMPGEATGEPIQLVPRRLTGVAHPEHTDD